MAVQPTTKEEAVPAARPKKTNKRRVRVKLIFNPIAGAANQSPVQLMDIIRELQEWNLIPEAFLVEPGIDLPGVVREALAQGIRLFVVCGGDGTISSVARTLAGSPATLGIIPIGTQNNTALSLGIPSDIPAAIEIIRTGQRIKVDMGMAITGNVRTPYMEVCSVGLVSALFPAADDIQHGNLARVADFLSTLASSPPADIRLHLENGKVTQHKGHVVLVSNMPYIGLHYQFGHEASYKDGLLDVMFFAEFSKLDLLGYVFQGVGVANDDPRIQRYHVRKIDIETQPRMPVMIDGIQIGEGRVQIEVRKRVLSMMVARPTAKAQTGKEDEIEQRTDQSALG
jgi:diacylglycerol kinase (ATP)